MKHRQDFLICTTCGARIGPDEAHCPICGARVTTQLARRSNIPHLLLEGLILAWVVAAALWFLKPTPTVSVAPVATPTHTPWPTPTYTDTPTPTLTPTATATPTQTPFCVQYVVGRGDTVEIIAEQFGLDLQDVLKRNWILSKEAILPGRVLCLPVPPERVHFLTPDPTATPTPLTYAIQARDNLAEIAARFDTTEELLIATNRLTETKMLTVGQKLIIVRILKVPGLRLA